VWGTPARSEAGTLPVPALRNRTSVLWLFRYGLTLLVLHSLLPSFRGSTLSPPGRARSPAKALDLASVLQVAQRQADHIPTNTGTGSFEVRERKRPIEGGNG